MRSIVTRRAASAVRRGRTVHRLSVATRICATSFMVLAGLALGSCSVVFTAGVQGQVVDQEVFDDSGGGGLDGVRVYIYIRERPRRLDREFYESDGLLPDETEDGRYYLETVTDTVGGTAGSFSFPTLYWNDLLPTYGRSGDRRDVFFLLYHPEYGLIDYTATIVSDTTNTLAPIELTWLFQETSVSGRLVRAGTSAGVGGVSVAAYAADSWSAGVFSYGSNDPEETTTAANGTYSITVTVPRAVVEAAGAGRARLTFSDSDYQIDSSIDALLDETTDLDGDGSPDSSYETADLPPDGTTELDTISIKQISFNESLDGRVGVDSGGDGNIDSGTNGAVVHLYFDAGSAPAPIDPPDLTTTTQNRLVDQEVEAGWFSFSDLEWYDDLYTAAQSSVTCYIDIDVTGDGTMEVDNRLVTLYSNTPNTVQIVLP